MGPLGLPIVGWLPKQLDRSGLICLLAADVDSSKMAVLAEISFLALEIFLEKTELPRSLC